MKRKKVNIFYFNFLVTRKFFWYFLVFVSSLQTYYDIYFFYILSLYFFLLQIIFCIYFLPYLLIRFCYFYNNLLLYLVLQLYFVDTVIACFTHFLYVSKKIYSNFLFSFRLELFIMFIASSLLIHQK